MNGHALSPRRSWTTVLLSIPIAVSATVTVPPIPTYAATTVQVWLTTADGASQLAQQPNISLGPVARGTLNVTVDDSRSFQTMVGMGAAFTDSSTFLMANLKANNPSQYNTMM